MYTQTCLLISLLLAFFSSAFFFWLVGFRPEKLRAVEFYYPTRLIWIDCLTFKISKSSIEGNGTFLYFSVDYFCQVAGCRTVPVELGARYTDEEWSQQLMTVSDFISQYIMDEVCYTCLFHLQTQQHGTGTDNSSCNKNYKNNYSEVISREGVCCKHSSELKGLTYFQDLKLGIIIATIDLIFTYNQMYSRWNLMNTYTHTYIRSKNLTGGI